MIYMRDENVCAKERGSRERRHPRECVVSCTRDLQYTGNEQTEVYVVGGGQDGCKVYGASIKTRFISNKYIAG